VDGDDVTTQLVDMVQTSSHYGQLRVIMTSDTIFGGVNVLDLQGVVKATKLPVIAVSDSKPDMGHVKRSLQQIDPNAWEEKLRKLTESGPIREVESHAGRSPVYLQWAGLPFEQAVEVVQKTATHSRIPEPIRVAHLFASSFVPD
jgi:endonuclease V-like protein UPF0215 family